MTVPCQNESWQLAFFRGKLVVLATTGRYQWSSHSEKVTKAVRSVTNLHCPEEVLM